MPSQSELRKRRIRDAKTLTAIRPRLSSRRDRQRLIFAVIAVVVVTMMVASLAVGLIA